MPRPAMPLEQLGLLCLLEKVTSEEGIDGIALYGLSQRGLITSSEPIGLTQAGAERLAELRKWRSEVEEELDSPSHP